MTLDDANLPIWVTDFRDKWGADTFDLGGGDGPLGPKFGLTGGVNRFDNPDMWADLTVGASQPVGCKGILSVTPSGGFATSGVEGGPFSPSSKVYTLSNKGAQPLN